MNERIEHCLYQAGLTAQGCWDELGTYEQEAIEKFAELIVRECVAIIQIEVGMKYKDGWEQHGVSDDWAAGHYNASLESRVLLKRHFGVEDTFKVGSRIKVISGFNVGAKGTVSYIEPTGRMWVRRDGASSDVFYHPEEVVGVE